MSEDRKRLQEVNATIERAVEHLNELYGEKKKLEEKLFD
jgi:predicted nuclease with TOPRIM domain